ncbi:acyl-CoA dehydrogenase family protein [Rhodococcus sp. JS3073]|uniref:acyl-CoA dehydrogenase family protein n=1 Tax=Rhodococcus sp. JS3073 TaxID=3002901 RepID=UPI002286CD36|nr:acyl-CoA dehydrogenase family protein [Rhodococcus sp. JS3073]WAM19627.1 acyl-CoA dehydrogenase family protein [Rhodococcus sp. JS3073]
MTLEIELGPEADIFRTEVRNWLAINRPAELIGVDPDHATTPQNAALADWAETVHRAGLMCISWSAEHGGRGLSSIEMSVLDEEFARADVPRPTRGVGEWLVAPAIMAWGTDEQKKYFLPRILDGTDVYCQGFSEPEAGSDLASLRTAGRIDGDEIVVSGQKVWTSGATRANMLFCLCRTDPAAPRHHGISYVLIPMRHPDGSANGIELRPIRQMTGDSDFTETFLDEARAPIDNIIGGVNNGWNVTMTTLGSERAGSTTTQHLPFARQLRMAIELAQSNGTNTDPVVRQQLAWAHTHVEIMRYQGLASLSEAIAGRTAGARASIIKMFWSEYSRAFLDRVANVRGAEAMILPMQSAGRYEPDYWTASMLQSRSSTIWGGTAEVQRNIVAERVLGLPRGN